MKKYIFLLTNSFYLWILGCVCIQTPVFLRAQTPCDCVPMLYESFNYDAGTTLHQKVGGTGWNGIWENQSGDTRLPGLHIGSNSLAYVNQLRTLGANATATDVINCTRQNMRAFFPNIRQTYRLAQLHGKPIAHYEGGQHMTSNPVIETFQQALYDSQIDPQIRTLYQEMIDSLRRYGGTTHAVAFTLTGLRESRYGSWGHVESSDQNLTTQPAPKYQVLLDNFRSVQGNCHIDLTALPLELTDFKAQCTSNPSIQLNWTTASEQNIKNFELECSYDANHWQTIGQMDSKGKTSNSSYQYLHYNDSLNYYVIYYRLKINELDGTINYSKVVSVMCNQQHSTEDFSIFPNPTYDVFTIQFHSKEVSKLELRDIMGRLIWIQSVDNQSSIQFSAQQLKLSAGVYYLKTDTNNGKTQRLIIL